MTDQEIGDLIKRLKGLYSVGPNGICEDRDFGTYTPAINKEAANLIASQQAKIKELQAKRIESISLNQFEHAFYKVCNGHISDLHEWLTTWNHLALKEKGDD